MKINDVEKITGLTQKAIRLYESKGLITVCRDSNGYRNYSPENVEALKSIKLFRSVGTSISDIKLYLFGVISIDELIDKRRAEILKESGKNSENYLICEKIANKASFEEMLYQPDFSEGEELGAEGHGALCVGIDLGTTTVSAVVYDLDRRRQLEAYAVPHNSYICSDIYSEQDVGVILEKAEKLLYHVIDTYSDIVSIGITGQMHGIAYIDKNGHPVSNLMNWQDKRADRVLDGGKSTCQIIKDKTGNNISTGYGLATHYYNMLTDRVPVDIAGFCSIMDLFAMKICGIQNALIHTSVASSLGLFDIKSGCFMEEKLSLLEMDKALLPRVTGNSITVGECRGIPVAIPLGDNQASFLGSVSCNKDSALVNIGTGSQISVAGDFCEAGADVELRPFIEGKYLICGSALCGGFAYSMLEEFFRSYAVSAGLQDEAQYKIINKLATMAYENGETGLDVDVSFFGKRSDPHKRGSIKNIDRQGFTPSALIIGVLKGMCSELYELYEGFAEKKKHIVASGGAVRRNEVLKRLIGDTFGVPISLSTVKEEAATGAALFSAFVTGKIKYENGFSEYIGSI